jgi:predicted RNA binding protein YcfA (HicA-like mRNA interferase family)
VVPYSVPFDSEMSRCAKLLEKAKDSPASLRFEDLCYLAECYDFFSARQKGSHHIYKRLGFSKSMNFQDVNGRAKEYQVIQLLDAIEEIEEDDARK